MSSNEIGGRYLSDALAAFRSYKRMAEKALGQVRDEEFFEEPAPGSNSAAVMVKHISGNQISRWTDFLGADGEKEWRDRDTEFEIGDESREGLMARWETGWDRLFGAIEPLEPDDLGRVVTIRGEPHMVIEAINRQLTHYAYHVGQIAYLARFYRQDEWKTLSVPKNRSGEFNEYLKRKSEAGQEKSHALEGTEEFLRDEAPEN